MKEYQAPEIELLDFTAEPIASVIEPIPSIGVGDSPDASDEEL